MKKIGILRETKTPVDNRVPFAPDQIRQLQKKLGIEIIVQHSEDRIFADEEYRKEGIKVQEDISDCDILMGIKEAAIDTLIPNKRYVFFGHIAKGQPYNVPLMKAMMGKGITFTDYEYLKDEKGRTCAFGFWAGVAGAYNTIRLYGLRYEKFELPKLRVGIRITDFFKCLNDIKWKLRKSAPKIVITGNGRVAQGAIWVLDKLDVKKTDLGHFYEKSNQATYRVARHSDLILNKRTGEYDAYEEKEHPEDFFSAFPRFAQEADILLACHYWDGKSAKHFTKQFAFSEKNHIHVVGDITCDINGSIETTIRPSSHDEPFYDVDCNLYEAPLFANPENISVMAVDTLPNAFAKYASRDFGIQTINSGIMEYFAQGVESYCLYKATIIRNGKITAPFAYLRELVEATEATDK